MIILGIRLVKGVECRYLLVGGDVHLTKICLGEEPFHHSLITLQELCDQCLGVFIAMVFRLHLVVAAQHERLQVERGIERAVSDALRLHGLTTHLIIGEQHAMPCEHRVTLQFQVIHDVAIRIHIMLTASAHLLLSGFQEVENTGLCGKLRIDGQCLHEHTHSVVQFLSLTTVIDGVEKGFRLVVELSQQIGVSHGEQCALEDTVRLTELLHLGVVHLQGAQQTGFLQRRLLTIREQLCKGVAAVEVLGIPLLGFLECRGLTQ